MGRSKAPLSEAALPRSPGIYAIWAAAESSLDDLGLEDVLGEEPLMTRPLYVGKDTGSLMERLKKHFEPGDTGHSTVRRTLDSLMDMESLPRKTRNERPNEDQVKTLIRNFDLAEQNDQDLSRWMTENLEVAGSASDYLPLRDPCYELADVPHR